MTKQEAINKLLVWLKSKNGYLEKSVEAYNKNHKIVFEMTEGAGNDNRCEAWEVLKPDYNQSSNAWCQGFVHLAFYQVFGEANAKKLLYLNSWKGDEPMTYYSCAGWSSNFENNGARYQSSKAQVGDIIYFTKSHTGIVVDIKDGYIYTCEGNTSGASGVVRNGGGVVYGKKYKSGASTIKMYGRPNWDAICKEPTPTYPTIYEGYKDEEKSGTYCKQLQQKLNKLNYVGKDGNKLSEDGHCGSNSVYAIKEFQKNNGLEVDGRFGPKSWACINGSPKAREVAKKLQVTAKSGLRLRKGPGILYGSIGTIANNTVLEYSEVKNNWYYIPSKNGWVCGTYTKQI